MFPELLPLFEWLEATRIGTAIRESIWAFPMIEAVHLLGLSLLGGAILLVDLRMLGLGLKKQPISEISGFARPWLLLAIVIMLATGIPLFLSEAIKCFYNLSFWIKITTLPVALLFTFLVRDRVARNHKLETSGKTRAVALASIALWVTVAAAGRWIGFS